MNREEIKKKIKEIISKRVGIDIKTITDSVSLTDNLGIDSFSYIEIFYELEDKFGIEIPEGDVANVRVFNDLVDYIASRISEKRT